MAPHVLLGIQWHSANLLTRFQSPTSGFPLWFFPSLLKCFIYPPLVYFQQTTSSFKKPGHQMWKAFHLLAFSKKASISYLLSPSYRGWNSSSYPRLTFHQNSRPQSLQDLVTLTHFPSHISLTPDNINISVPPILTKWSLNSAFTDRLPSCRIPGSYHPISWFQLPRYRLHFLPELKSQF